MKRILLGIFFALSLSAFSQDWISFEANHMRDGDTIIHREVLFFDAGESGENVTWDFREIKTGNNVRKLWFKQDTVPAHIYGLTLKAKQDYIFKNDSLSLAGYETALTSMKYDKPLTICTYPFAYGAHLLQPYHGTGTYCRKYLLDHQGTMEVDADAYGTIYTDGDTLHHVLRLHYIFSSAIRQYSEGDTLREKEDVKQRIEEQYLWYARGYRYPVLGTTSVTIYHNLQPVSCQQTAYSTLPSDQELLDDEVNRQIQISDSIAQAHQAPIIHYQITTEGNAVIVSYTLDADANISAIVCDRMGVVYRRATTTDSSGATGILRLDGNGLKSGIYVLYLNVNGQIYNEKVEL